MSKEKELKELLEKLGKLMGIGSSSGKRCDDHLSKDVEKAIDGGIKKFTDDMIDYANENGKNQGDRFNILLNMVRNVFIRATLIAARVQKWSASETKDWVKESLDGLKEGFDLNLDMGCSDCKKEEADNEKDSD